MSRGRELAVVELLVALTDSHECERRGREAAR